MNLHEQPFDPQPRRRRAARARRRRARVSEVLRSGYTWKGEGPAHRRWSGKRPGVAPGRWCRGRGDDMAAQREWYEKDYYKVLGVSDDATPRRSPRPIASSPATATPTPTPATTRPRSGSRRSARPTTCSATKPSARSTTRSAGSARCGRVPMGGGPGGPRRRSDFNVGADGLGDLLGQMFGRGRRGGGASAGGGPQRGADVEATLTLDFADAVTGLTTTLYLTTDAQCSTCNGIGRQARHAAEGVLATAAVVASSTTTRASSRSRRRATCAAAAVWSSRIRARRAAASASRSASARCRRASPPASPTGRRSA